jgi:hypothetical protein
MSNSSRQSAEEVREGVRSERERTAAGAGDALSVAAGAVVAVVVFVGSGEFETSFCFFDLAAFLPFSVSSKLRIGRGALRRDIASISTAGGHQVGISSQATPGALRGARSLGKQARASFKDLAELLIECGGVDGRRFQAELPPVRKICCTERLLHFIQQGIHIIQVR